MRIAIVVLAFPEISETFVLNQITELLRRGHDVRIFSFASRAYDVDTIHQDIFRFGLIERTCYIGHKRIRKKRLRAIAVALDAIKLFALSPAKAMQIWSVRRRAPQLWFFGFIPLALALRKDAGFDVLHCQFGHLGILGAMCRDTGLLRGKLMVSFRGADITRWLHTYGEELYRYTCSQASRLFPVCEFFAEKLRSVGCASDKIIVLRSGLDLARFPFFPHSQSKSGVVRFLSIGRLVEKKGLKYCLLAFSDVYRSHPKTKYIIVGDGPLEGELKSLVSRLGIERAVHFAGRKTQEQLLPYFKRCHIFLATSVTTASGEQEGIPNTLKEAMASGLPVIGTHHSGIPELVNDGVSGLLVAEKDVEKLSQAMYRLLDKPEDWIKMGNSARKVIERDYDLKSINDRLEQLYLHSH